MRRATAAAVAALALLVWFAPPASAGDPVKDRQAAQARANAAAARFARATTELAKVERDLATLQAKTAATRDRLSVLEGQVKLVAVNSYVRGNLGDQLVFDPDLSKTARRNAMVRFANDTDRSAIDQYRAARQDLEVGSDSVRKQLEERKSAAAALRKQRQAAYGELTRLQAAEKAYLAKVAAEKAAAAKRAAGAKASRAAPVVVTPAAKAGRPSGVIATGDWICPVQGPHSFSDDFGQPRSGGRTHEGNDILNPRGTPIVASVSGTVSFHNSSLGGLSYYLHGDDGNTYFGTHLGSYAQDGRVSAGTVVGYNGDSGNARGTPHLHFEIHPGGGSPVDPYPTLVKYC
jgi:murein DD-endopeptidase MepM/ murein hydrolase activator NlpD